MRRPVEKVDQRHNDDEASDSVKSIIDTYFNFRAVVHMNKMIDAYSRREGGLKRALSTIYKATNYSRDSFQKYLTELCSGRSQGSTQRLLEIISCYSSGELEKEDLVLLQCKALSNLSLDVLKKQIGIFYRKRTNEFIREKNPELYEEIKLEERGKEEMVANDVSRTSPPKKRVEDGGGLSSSEAGPSATVSSPVAEAMHGQKQKSPDSSSSNINRR